MRNTIGLSLGCLLAGALLLASGCKAKAPDNSKAATTQADTSSLLAKLGVRNRPALIQFGRVGCEVSDKGLAAMAALAESNAIPGLAMARVEMSTDPKAVTAYYKDRQVGFPIVPDADGSLARQTNVTATPTVLLVDRFGHVRYRGQYPQEQLGHWAALLLAETADAGSNAPMLGKADLDIPKLLGEPLHDLTDANRALADYMGSNGLFVLFVDTRCPYSGEGIKDMPLVQSVLQAHRITSVVVNLDDPKPAVLKYYREHNPGAAVLYDPTKDTGRQWSIHSVPTGVLISNGKKLAHRGPAVWAELAAAVEKELSLPAGSVRFAPSGTSSG